MGLNNEAQQGLCVGLRSKGCIPVLQKYLAIGNRGYTNEVRLRGLLKPAEAGFVYVGANSIRQLH